MSQDYQGQDSHEYTVSTSRAGRRRRARNNRNRPTLVTANEQDQELNESTEETSTQSESAVAVAEAPTNEVKPRRSFFSRLGRNEEQATSKEEASRARLARATHGKTPEEKSTSETPKVAKPAARPGTRPNSLFKTRWIIGMALYLLIANFAGIYEQQAIKSMGLERVVTNFDLFGLSMRLSTSTLVYLATLVILLIVLARFDLIPRSLTGNSAARGKQTTSRSSSSSATPKAPQQTIRQGSSGEDDDLYREYRISQRRSKKR